MSDGAWEKRRAVLGFLEIARDAMSSADCMLDDEVQATKALKDAIYAARLDILKTLDAVPPVPVWESSGNEGRE